MLAVRAVTHKRAVKTEVFQPNHAAARMIGARQKICRDTFPPAAKSVTQIRAITAAMISQASRVLVGRRMMRAMTHAPARCLSERRGSAGAVSANGGDESWKSGSATGIPCLC